MAEYSSDYPHFSHLVADYNCLNLSATLTVLNLKIKHRDNKVYLILRLFAFFCLLQLDSRQILALSDLKLRF